MHRMYDKHVRVRNYQKDKSNEEYSLLSVPFFMNYLLVCGNK